MGFQKSGQIMRAIRIHGFGGIDTMRLDDIPRPVPGAGEVLVAVKAAGVGRSGTWRYGFIG
jgi:NADPH:quinone reductase-like Zn-dependent oxidoreductase